MSQLNVKLNEDHFEALKRYANLRQTPVSWLIKDYVEYRLAGGEPVTAPASDTPPAMELAKLAQRGGAFDWLADEPDVYSVKDGEPV